MCAYYRRLLAYRNLANVRQRAEHLLKQPKEILSQDVLRHDTKTIDIRARSVNSKSEGGRSSASGQRRKDEQMTLGEHAAFYAE